MRKAYSKPLILAEPLAMIGNGSPCEGISLSAFNQCPIFIPDDVGGTLLLNMDMGCEQNVANAEDVICYHNPDEYFNVFGS